MEEIEALGCATFRNVTLEVEDQLHRLGARVHVVVNLDIDLQLQTIANMIEAAAPTPGERGPYRKRENL